MALGRWLLRGFGYLEGELFYLPLQVAIEYFAYHKQSLILKDWLAGDKIERHWALCKPVCRG